MQSGVLTFVDCYRGSRFESHIHHNIGQDFTCPSLSKEERKALFFSGQGEVGGLVLFTVKGSALAALLEK